MSFLITINGNNVISNNNTVYRFNFVNGSFVADDMEMCIGLAQIPYSWYNITTNYNNNSFQISWTVGVTTTLYTIIIPDGFYSVDDINSLIEEFCILNGFYLIDASLNNIYYFKILDNPSLYKVQLLLYTFPNSLPTGYTTPTNFVGFPTVATTPQFIVLNNNFQIYTGFINGIYGGGSLNLSIVSQNTPLGANVNSLVFRCSLVSNNISFPNDILDNIPIINASFGQNINYAPAFEKFITINDGSYSTLTLYIQDQNYNTVYALDSNVSISLLIRKRKN